MEFLDELRKQVGFYSDTLKISEVSAEYGKCRVIMDITDEIIAPFGMVFGGAVFSLAESAAALASTSLGAPCVTMDSNINFLNPGLGEHLYADGNVIMDEETSCVVEVVISDDEEVIISKATFTMFKISVSAL